MLMNEKFLEIKNRYIKEFGHHPAQLNFISDIEKNLNITLPEEFKDITKYFDGYGLDYFYIFTFKCDNSDINIYSETVRLRNSISLPNNWLFISEPPESAILMDCSKIDYGEILWIDSHDIYNLESQDFTSKVDRWPSFTDFMEFLFNLHDDEKNET